MRPVSILGGRADSSSDEPTLCLAAAGGGANPPIDNTKAPTPDDNDDDLSGSGDIHPDDDEILNLAEVTCSLCINNLHPLWLPVLSWYQDKFYDFVENIYCFPVVFLSDLSRPQLFRHKNIIGCQGIEIKCPSAFGTPQIVLDSAAAMRIFWSFEGCLQEGLLSHQAC